MFLGECSIRLISGSVPIEGKMQIFEESHNIQVLGGSDILETERLWGHLFNLDLDLIFL